MELGNRKVTSLELARLVNVSREAVERLIDASGIEPDQDPDAPAFGG